MNITGTLPSDKLPIFFLKPNFTSRHACLEVKITRVYDMIDWLSALRMHEKTGHDNKGMSGHGFTFPVGGSVPVIFISMVPSLFGRVMYSQRPWGRGWAKRELDFLHVRMYGWSDLWRILTSQKFKKISYSRSRYDFPNALVAPHEHHHGPWQIVKMLHVCLVAIFCSWLAANFMSGCLSKYFSR
jgi:hypothetical protein